jgi:hypothetical protein
MENVYLQLWVAQNPSASFLLSGLTEAGYLGIEYTRIFWYIKSMHEVIALIKSVWRYTVIPA